MDDSNKCGSCLYWRRKGNTMTGKCHRHAPKRIPSKEGIYVNDWAVTNEGDFCGDFGPAAPPAGKPEKPESIPIKEIFTSKPRLSPLEERRPRQ
jgi:hypothetical protein